jgi:hypothetical protein
MNTEAYAEKLLKYRPKAERSLGRPLTCWQNSYFSMSIMGPSGSNTEKDDNHDDHDHDDDNGDHHVDTERERERERERVHACVRACVCMRTHMCVHACVRPPIHKFIPET